MKASKSLRLNKSDFVKGLIVTILAAVLGYVKTALESGDLFPINWEQVGTIAGLALIAYLSKNLTTNSKGQSFKKEI